MAGIKPRIEVKAIPVAEARRLRKAILRPDLPPETTIYPGDDAPDTFHAGAFLDGELAGITTALREAPPGQDEPGAWRLRGVAVAEKARGLGLGRLLVQACLQHIDAQEGVWVWANGRTPSLPFYRALGFQVQGEEYITDSGPHYRVWRAVT